MTDAVRYAVAGGVAFAVMWVVLSFQVDGLRWTTGIAGGVAFAAVWLVLDRIRRRR